MTEASTQRYLNRLVFKLTSDPRILKFGFEHGNGGEQSYVKITFRNGVYLEGHDTHSHVYVVPWEKEAIREFFSKVRFCFCPIHRYHLVECIQRLGEYNQSWESFFREYARQAIAKFNP